VFSVFSVAVDRILSRTAVIFGAGNIGRGFIAQLFHESGLEIVFVDVSTPAIEAINRDREYDIHIVGLGTQKVRIDGIGALPASDSEGIAEALAGCEIACTAVGAAALPHIAPNLARGLERRFRRGGGPLNVLICENLHNAAGELRAQVAKHLPEEMREGALARTGFVQAVVSRMVPLQQNPPDDLLSIRVEAYKRLPVDGAAVVGELPPIVGLEEVRNFEAHVERKLYTHNCAHATLGYLGFRRGHVFGHQALKDPEIRWLLFEGSPSVIGETGESLIRRHRFDRDEHGAHVTDLILRFENVELGDTCFRLGRDPLRKLAPNDRLVGAARLCESQGVRPVALPVVIGEALRFDSEEDPSAIELQRRIQNDGIVAVMREVCGIQPQEPLAARVKAAYDSAIEAPDE
jgi:mannitol-1-phosphate 5-dehydrogenase